MKIAYVCTNYNNSNLTSNAVNSLHREGPDEFLSVIVDNNSDSENKQILKAFSKDRNDIMVIWNEENIGYFRGLNLGIRYAKRAMNGLEFMFIGNNDLLFPVDIIKKLENVQERINCFPVISPDIITLDMQHQNPHVISKISKFREMVYDLYHLNYVFAQMIQKMSKWTRRLTDRADEQEWEVGQFIHQGYGACYILTPRFWDHFEELWAPSFLMGEEYFLSKQLRDVDMDVYYEPSIVVQHICHATMSKVPSRLMWEFSRQAHKVRRKFVKIF